MMVMTAKVDMKKIVFALAAVASLIVALLLFLGDGDSQTTSATVSNNDARVQFLESFGWDVAASPTQSSPVRIPEEASEVFDRYNTLQKTQGYDLRNYAGEKVMRHVYKVNNYPGATDPVYATLLVHKNTIIGGDVTDTSANGQVRGFKMPPATTAPTTSSEPTAAPGESVAATSTDATTGAISPTLDTAA